MNEPKYGTGYFANLPVVNDSRVPAQSAGRDELRTIRETDSHGNVLWEWTCSLAPHFDDVIRMRRLYRAALDQAVDDLSMTPVDGEDEHFQAWAVEWLKGHVTHGASTSHFTDTCDLADLDPDWVRRKITEIVTIRKKLEHAEV